MPRGRRKGREELLYQQAERQGSQDSSGPPRLKSKFDTEEERASGGGGEMEVPVMAQYCSPHRSFREKITDFFNSSEDTARDREGSASPQMPLLLAQDTDLLLAQDTDSGLLGLPPLTPPRLSTPEPGDDCEGSERSEGDSGKENEDSAPVIWRGSRGSLASRGSRPRSGHLADLHPGQQGNLSSPLALGKDRGRVTRSSLGKIPLSLKSCERLQNEFNIADGVHGSSTRSFLQSPSSPPTPHKIIRVKEPGLCNPLQKLKQISLTPKKSSGSSTKRNKVNKRLAGCSAGLAGAPSPASKAGKLAAAASTSHKVTEYFPIRRSERKPKGELLKEQMEGIEARLLNTDDSMLDIEITDIENKGRGIKAIREFAKGEFVVEYAGDLIDVDDAKDRESKYSMDTSKGCYMYYFKHKGKQYCIDATGESGRYGRLLNHSTKAPNCATKVVMLGDTPRLILVAKQDISEDTELLYDYGDRSKESLKAHPWLAF
jgi:histone-lysine N-methyltransferase SETD8